MRIIKRLLLALFAVVVLAGLAGAVLVWTAFPKYEGAVDVAGLSAAVEVYRDRAAVPYIYAETEADAYVALGFVHAQDRFWQMEMMRRFGAGRLSEVLGAATLGTDRWMRTLGLYGLAEARAQTLPEAVQAALASYAQGVNQWLDTKTGLGAIELVAFHYQPEPWVPADSLVWGKIMATRLAGNFRKEMARSRVVRKLGQRRADELWPDYPSTAPVTAARHGNDGPNDLFAGLDRLLPEPVGLPRGASNQWVVGPNPSRTGAPILANDPHLGFSAPILWYLAHIEAPGLTVTGATVPGVPFHILGHNGQVAWGITSTQADQEDLVIEQTVGNDAASYRTPEGMRVFTGRQEVIRIKDQPDQVLTVRATVHGPVISDLRGAAVTGADKTRVVALNAVYLKSDDQTFNGLYLLNRAGDWPAFRRALGFVSSPALNISYADKAGNIGFQVAGALPVRTSGDGSLPASGWTGDGDWSGVVPFTELPSQFNPVSGLIINANNPVGNPAEKPFISRDWAAPYRAQRIEMELNLQQKHTLDAMQALQRDELSLMARALLPVMSGLARPQTETERRALALLAQWNGEMARDRPEPLLFSHWLRELNRALYADDLGDLADGLLGLRPQFVLNSLMAEPGAWCDNTQTDALETCADMVSLSLGRAISRLVETRGEEISAWQWGEAHRATFAHPVFGRIPLLQRLASLSIANGGGDYTVNRGASRVNNEAAPFRHIHGPGYRAVYDLSDLRKSKYMIATGQSGNFLSSHYRDQLENWRDGRYLEIDGSRNVVVRQSGSRLRLLPVLR